MSDTPDVEHGIGGGSYANTFTGGYRPTLYCLCGFETNLCDSWEEAGLELDDHLREFIQEPSR